MATEITFFVNDEPIVVHTDSLTANEILDDAGFKPAGDFLLVEHKSTEQTTFPTGTEPVALTEGARFHARPRFIKIIVNRRERKVENPKQTFDDIVALAPDLPPLTADTEYRITYHGAESHPHDGDLIQGEFVIVKDGTSFRVSTTNRS
jgi:hypothetical protein